MKTTSKPTHEVRQNRGTGNGGSAYLNSPFWDSIQTKKETKVDQPVESETFIEKPMTEEELRKKRQRMFAIAY